MLEELNNQLNAQNPSDAILMRLRGFFFITMSPMRQRIIFSFIVKLVVFVSLVLVHIVTQNPAETVPGLGLSLLQNKQKNLHYVIFLIEVVMWGCAGVYNLSILSYPKIGLQKKDKMEKKCKTCFGQTHQRRQFLSKVGGPLGKQCLFTYFDLFFDFTPPNQETFINV